jgi:single-stranded-DNA-specific exonuclease
MAHPLPTTRWQISTEQDDDCDLLCKKFGIHPLLCRILMNRSIRNLDDADKYLFPSLKDLHNPFLMKDMKKGVDRVVKAICSSESIFIYGDYDVDGITSLVAIYKFLLDLGANVHWYLPKRISEGYGLNCPAVELIRRKGATLIITVDCGISNDDEIKYARSLAMDTIVLDHHEVPDTFPTAEAVINTNRSDCSFPFKPLAGVGIVFNFLIALRSTLQEIGFWNTKTYPNLKCYLDLVALGTIGDVCPLLDENRIFVKFGLEQINEGKRIGLNALREVVGAGDSPVDSIAASFQLIPRLNAAGRVASAETAIRLLLTENKTEAQSLALQLDGYNRTRQVMERSIFSEITDEIANTIDLKRMDAIVLASENWHPGVIGIVASRLAELYYRPAFLISLKDGIGKGSGRSIPAFNLHKGLVLCRSLLLAHGGHRFAAGISIKEANIERFAQLLGEAIRTELQPADFIPSTAIDAQCRLKEIDFSLLKQFDLLAPFGNMNPEPVLLAKNLSISFPTVVGNNHLKMRINGDSATCGSIWFGKGNYLPSVSDSKFDIVFTPQRNVWNGISSIQLKVRDLAVSE